jgi:hypothetical protein
MMPDEMTTITLIKSTLHDQEIKPAKEELLLGAGGSRL